MDERHRRVRRARARVAGDLAGDDPDERAAVGRRDQRHLRCPQVLVARRGELLVPRQVDPELDPVEQPAARHEPLRRLLDVEDPGAGCHPLGVAVGDRPAATVRVLVLERAVHHVGDRLEPAVRVPGRALRLARRVVDLAHLVHVDERVEIGEVDMREGAANREALPFNPVRAIVRLLTGRSRAVVGSGSGMRGRTVMSSTVIAGMAGFVPLRGLLLTR